MTPTNNLPGDLRAHERLCREVLAVVELESSALRQADDAPSFQLFQTKQRLLPRLEESLQRLRRHRQAWQQLTRAQRAQHAEVASLFRLNQELIMRILVLDRENEQTLLRRGLVPPEHLPSVNRQRPGYVAGLYGRHQPSVKTNEYFFP